MAETPEKKTQYWCFDGSSWRLIDDPLEPEDGSRRRRLDELHREAEFELLLGPGVSNLYRDSISLWKRGSKPECPIHIFKDIDVDDCGMATVYADRLPDGIDLFARWAPATYAHGGEPEPST